MFFALYLFEIIYQHDIAGRRAAGENKLSAVRQPIEIINLLGLGN